MIQLERVLQISVYLMAALSSLMLGMGEQVWVYVVILWMAAVAAYFYTDRWQWVVLPRIPSNILALAAGGLALFEVVRGGQEYQLLGVAHFLVYFQVIIFFQKKRPREYAQIAVLGLFQVMVAAVVSLNVNFALFLAAELFLSLWVLALLQLNRQWHIHRELDAVSETPSAGLAGTISPKTQSQGDGFTNGSAVGIEQEFPANQLARFTVTMGIMALGVAILVFPFVPRVRKVGWVGNSTVAITGLTQDVKLGNIKKILESNEEVMTVALRHTRNTGEEVYKAPGKLLMRGYVLNRYAGNGLWVRAATSEKGRRLAQGFATNSIRQEIDLQKNELSVLFAMQPIDTALYGPDEKPLAMDQHTGALLAPLEIGNRQIRYTVYTLPRNLLTDYSLNLEHPVGPLLRELLQLPSGVEKLVQFARTRAKGIVPESGRSQASPLRKAQNLEAYLLDSNRFTYSLETGLPSPGASTVDPVEDFLLNHRTGYCEYFASALTLMLRAADIPARMVAGYKGGEYNDIGDYYVILDKHAHNWVEAYVEDRVGEKRWIILDPTPAIYETEDTAIVGSWYSRFHVWKSFCQHLWSSHVVNLDNSRQQKAIRDAGNHLFGSLARWRDQVEAKGAFGGLFSQSTSRGFWGRVSTVVLGVLALGGVSLAFWLVVRGVSGLMRRFRWGRQSADNGQTIEVEFYRRLVEVLERHQLIRPPASTHLEFASLAGQNLAMQPHTQSVAGIPGRVIESFQRVRFGHEALAPEQEAELLTSISELEKCIERGNNDSVPSQK